MVYILIDDYQQFLVRYRLPRYMKVGDTATIKVYFINKSEYTLGVSLSFPKVDEALEVGAITLELPIVEPHDFTTKSFPLTALKPSRKAKITVGGNGFNMGPEDIAFYDEFERRTYILPCDFKYDAAYAHEWYDMLW